MINHLALNTPYFGILLSVIPFFLVTILFEKTNRFFLFAPLFVSMVFGVAFLYLTGIPYKTYKIGGHYLLLLRTGNNSFLRFRYIKSVKCLLNIGIVSSEVLVSVIVVALLIILTFASQHNLPMMLFYQCYLKQRQRLCYQYQARYRWYKRINIISSYFKCVIIYALGNKFLKLFESLTLLPRGLALGQVVTH